jgi:hypothetical protein
MALKIAVLLEDISALGAGNQHKDAKSMSLLNFIIVFSFIFF